HEQLILSANSDRPPPLYSVWPVRRVLVKQQIADPRRERLPGCAWGRQGLGHLGRPLPFQLEHFPPLPAIAFLFGKHHLLPQSLQQRNYTVERLTLVKAVTKLRRRGEAVEHFLDLLEIVFPDHWLVLADLDPVPDPITIAHSQRLALRISQVD